LIASCGSQYATQVLKLNKAAAHFSEHGWFEEKVVPTAHPLAVAWAATPKTAEVPVARSPEPDPEPEHTKCDTNTKEDWRTAAEHLISQNSQRLAMIETELEKKIAEVTAKAKEEIKSLRQAYQAATEGLRDENKSLKETLEQLFPTTESTSE
jgi:DNA-binding LacI/PurR family transcriptional regulator